MDAHLHPDTDVQKRPARKLKPLKGPPGRPFPAPLEPTEIRYIKLGEAGRWFDLGITEGQIRFHDRVPHEVALSGDWDEARRIYVEAGDRTPGNSVRELREFYTQGPDCLWITLGQGRLWWGFAEPEVSLEANDDRVRRMRGSWSCLDAAGAELTTHGLSTRLTKVHGYKRTVCAVSAQDYLLRRLNGVPDPVVVQAQALQAELKGAMQTMIADLDWREFEVMVDLIFAGSGWRRITGVGGSDQADTDMILEQALTGERAFVQVKSEANGKVFADYLERFSSYPDVDLFIFACHTPRGRFPVSDDPAVRLWRRPELAEQAFRAGLVDWLIEKRR